MQNLEKHLKQVREDLEEGSQYPNYVENIDYTAGLLSMTEEILEYISVLDKEIVTSRYSLLYDLMIVWLDPQNCLCHDSLIKAGLMDEKGQLTHFGKYMARSIAMYQELQYDNKG